MNTTTVEEDHHDSLEKQVGTERNATKRCRSWAAGVLLVIAGLGAHLAHPAGDALGIVLIQVAQHPGIGQIIQPAVLRTDDRHL